ncbi:Endonuclease MutS2 [Coccomyxa sp. Obi]|nr:Endonuclease MutS2 [Coccomyxa sp. Obi]
MIEAYHGLRCSQSCTKTTSFNQSSTNCLSHRRPLLRVTQKRRSLRSHRRSSQSTAFASDGEAADRRSSRTAAADTQNTLEWSRLCSHVTQFASTTLGRHAALQLQVPEMQVESEQLLAETRAVDVLEAEYAAELDFGGISTAQAQEGIKRASRGGMLTAAQLTAVAGLLAGADRLRRAILSAAGQEGRLTEDSILWPVVSCIKGLPAHAEIVGAVNAAIDENARVRDGASEDVRRTRGRCRTIEGRLRSLLKGFQGEVSEQSGRLCVAVSPADKPPKGVMLGSSGGVLYLEPPAAVPLNNELAAARGEAYAAEEAVLWRVTGLIVDAEDDVRRALELVLWLDLTAAKARYGRWIGGELPQFADFARTTRARTARQREAQALQHAAAPQEADDEFLVRLRKLRHPLLHADYLIQREAEARTQPQSSRAAAPGPLRRLSNRKDVMARNSGTISDDESGGEEADTEDEERPARPPVPIDICMKPETRCVIITGPNTGGKTATLKAFGLAVLMAKAGLAVPAAAPVRLPPFSKVLADIGDEQSLAANLSTFSGHLRRIQALRRETDGKALVLLDEVGTGTDPAEGAALGIALLRALAAGGARGAAVTIATTHHSSLTSLKYQDARFENASVEFDEAALAPTYRLMWGIPGRSNALNIAGRLGLEPAIIAAARERMGTAQGEVDDAIADLENLRKSAEADELAAMKLKKQAGTLQQKVKQTRKKMDEAEAKRQLHYAENIAKAVDAAESQINAHARKLKSAEKKQADQAAKAQEEQRQKEKEVKAFEQQKKEEWVPTLGSMVFVPRMKGKFKVVAVNGSQVTVQLGALKVKVGVDEVRR